MEIRMNDEFTWRTSSFSVNDNCVEVAVNGDHVLVRNSNHREAGTVQFTHDEWDAFLKGARAGEFDI